MRSRREQFFTTIRTEGSILPPDLLQKIDPQQTELEGLTAESYGLSGERINEAINQSWGRLRGAWQNFQSARQSLPESDRGTTMTRQRWLLPLFDSLSYGRLQTTRAIEIDGQPYPVSHGWGSTPIHLVSFKIESDQVTPGVAGAARNSPHSLLQELLNRSDQHLWGFLSNGLKLRILRDNKSLTRQAYVEFDLEAMMEGEVYPDFCLLWLLCHASRVALPETEEQTTVTPDQCWLEKWSQTAQTEGVRALDQLRSGVELTINTLGAGFLKHPANEKLHQDLRSGQLDTQDYYRQLLRLIYRLIFLFVAEDRRILFSPQADEESQEIYHQYYSATRLRQIAERQRGSRHSDLIQPLWMVMDFLGQEQGCLQLGLPALGSFLFSSQAMADLQGCQISNLDLLTAIRHLSTITDGHTRRLVDYRNLRSEELGSIYESLLELYPELNIEAGTFELRSAGGSERKTTGSYYTPDSLVQCLLDSALEPVMDQALENSDDAEKALLQLKVCDPACGSGHFLIAAAHRMAKRLASIRTGTQEPAPQATRTALRDVIGSCIYGVDINEMAVELCKVSLWMEALEPGKPLSFLDHRIKTGNSLLGATPALLQDGIPDDAFKPIEGDDKKYCQTYRKQNKEERSGQMSFLYDDAFSPWQWQKQLASAVLQIAETADDDFYSVKSQEQTYQRLLDSRDYDQSKLWADAWCAAFVWHKTSAFPYPITQEVFRKIGQNPGATTDWMHREIRSLANEYQFFHWHLAFPEVFHMPAEGEIAENEQLGWNGGFDVVLGNPPWERVKLQEKEFFASRDPEIASAPNKAARELLISDLETENPELWAEFKQASRQSAGIRHLLRDSNIYPLCGRGDVNLYTVFAEANRFHLNPTGLTGCVLPTGIATDDTTKFFFQDLMDKQALRSFYDFENRKGFFPDVDSRMKFCCFTAGSGITPVAQATVFAFFLHETAELSDPNKLFTLSHRDIELLNPNTRTCPIFRSRTDAELTRHIYRRVPALINENDPENGDPWGIKFSRMFDMSNDSHLFYTRQQLEDEGWQLQGNVFNKYGETYLPLY
ncbi:MAG: N-6 DNA methylase, partial [Gammaproteobacteria bacterium]|nr:N-6 DNA methylase [Gammaproteobacteria bacterium]